ncbi:unnamed protein product [[Candida] boidinii]|uniref:Unnamed protein product n=1 Tax=Candida boidinii TaxID=5477 RepID=A0A9W6SWP4_CANBO|nr:hydrolase activity protein [[Candida] boidinii]GME68379.1 unnamed protein product [[Candida] boidinii]GMG00228.1 unnamed protein product [[Candida] boidinii]
MAFNVRGTDETKVLDLETLPYEITKIENIPIPLKDGCTLYAHIWIPVEEWENPDKSLGALVEYIPYRKDDCTSMRDAIRHPFFAGNGFASIRIDMRGCGDSEGILEDEYLKQEQDDALEAFDWIVEQKWSNGNIAMFGKSWGGFNGLQVAARQHPAMKTAISLMSTDDRYSDDVHYRGGSLFASDMLWWGSTMTCYGPRPRDPVVAGDSWKENWIERLNVKPMVSNWVTHQTRDEYWKHGSICEDYNQVQIPILCIGGWRDGYTSPVFRMVKNLPHKNSCGLVGPWVHEYPEMAEPSPKIGFQQLAVKWFSKWLYPGKEEDFELPKMTAYVQDPSSIKDSYIRREGEWVSLNTVANPKELSYFFSNDRKLTEVAEESFSSPIEVSGVSSHGLFRGTYCPFGFKGDFPTDQRYEDSKCVTFDSDIFEESVNLLGEPIAQFTLSSDKKLANLSVRLVDIYPDNGEHVLISWGQLNLTHRNSHEFPEYLTPGEKYEIKIPLDVLGIKVEKGHKLRIALSTCDWPQAWPTPEIPTLKIFKGKVVLPSINGSEKVAPPNFASPTIMKGLETEIIEPFGRDKTVTFDYPNNEWRLVDVQDSGNVRLPDMGTLSGITFGNCNTNIWKIKENDPLSAYNECSWTYTMGRGDWQVSLETKTVLKSDKDNFYLTNKLKAWHGEELLKDKTWDEVIPRQFM